jgi:RelA/SpoT family (p)ppGpp synthetase
MIISKEIPLDEDSVISAILHDIWSDSDKYDYNYVLNEFGKGVADIVDVIHKIRATELEVLDQPEKIDNYRKFLLALSTDFRVILVKLADTLENMRNVGFKSPKEQERLARETMEIYTPFANRLGLRNLKWELDDLAFKILNPFEYESISNYLSENKFQRESYINKFIELIQERLEKDEFLKKNKITFELSGRAKHIFSIHNKMRLRKKSLDELFDLFAIRVVLNTPDPNICFYVYGIIASIYPPVPETFKDYISSPKKNGYKSIHTAVFGIDNKILEIQIRTEAMHHYSESGIAAHFKYKTHIQTNSVLEKEEIQKWMLVVREIFENPGEENSGQILDEVRTNLFEDEIYVYTPTNEFINLPINSMPLDFAYHIHSDIGNHFVGAKVNGKMVTIDYRLRNGDKVEIIISAKAKPKEDWLEYAITSKARNQLHKYFKIENKNKEIRGRERWKNEISRRKIYLDDSRLLDFLQEFKIERLSDFYIAIANEEIDLVNFSTFIIQKIFEKSSDKQAISSQYEKESRKILSEAAGRSELEFSEPILHNLGKEISKYSFIFIAKENYSLGKKITDIVMQFNDIFITKFNFDIEKSKVTGELVFESDNSVQAKSLLTRLNLIEGILHIDNSN